jgi:hypothetical protein
MEALERNFQIVVDIGFGARLNIKQKLEHSLRLNRTFERSVAEAYYQGGNRFCNYIYHVYKEAMSQTKAKYGHIKGSIFMPEVNSLNPEQATDVLLKCNKTILVGSVREIYQKYEALQNEQLKPLLYVGKETSFSNPRV